MQLYSYRNTGFVECNDLGNHSPSSFGMKREESKRENEIESFSRWNTLLLFRFKNQAAVSALIFFPTAIKNLYLPDFTFILYPISVTIDGRKLITVSLRP